MQNTNDSALSCTTKPISSNHLKGLQESEKKTATRFNKSFHNLRYVIVALGGLICGAMLFARNSITFSMLTMVNQTHLYITEHSNMSVKELEAMPSYEDGEFKWNNVVQQFVIAGYKITYVLPQFYVTRLNLKYGLHLSVPLNISICGISCLLSPLAARLGWGYLLVMRLLNGLGASSIVCTMVALIEIWIPQDDFANGVSMFQFVHTILYIFTPLSSGYLAAIGWQWCYYVPGLVCILCAIIWWLIVSDNPESCELLSEKEFDLIKATPANTTARDGNKLEANNQPAENLASTLAWHFMFKFRSFYVVTIIWIIFIASDAGFCNVLPSYFHKALALNATENGFYNFLVQLSVLGSMLWLNPIIGYLQKSLNMSLTSARNLILTLVTVMSVLTWSYVGLFHKNQIIAIAICRFFNMTNETLVLATIMSKFGRHGLSSLVFSIVNSIGNPASLVFSTIVGRFLDYTGESLTCWSWVFHSLSIMNIILLLLYILFLDSEPEDLSSLQQNEHKEKQNPGALCE